MGVIERNTVKVIGKGNKTMMFAHGFGCDQNMWRFVTPAFENEFKIILFDLTGSGNSDKDEYDFQKYNTLHGYANDVIEICDTLHLENVTFVGHSVSAVIGALVDIKRPKLLENLIMVSPSPCYINKDEYIGGFTVNDITELMESLEANYLGWSSAITPVIMSNADRPELSQELENSFCRNDPKIAQHFAKVTFLGDYRKEVNQISAETLIMQCSADVIAPIEVGKYLHENIENSTLSIMKATGHCPNLSAPDETIQVIKNFLNLK